MSVDLIDNLYLFFLTVAEENIREIGCNCLQISLQNPFEILCKAAENKKLL